MKITLFTFLLLVASQSAVADVNVNDPSQVKLGENRRGLSAEATHCKETARLKKLAEENEALIEAGKARAGR